MGKKKVTLSVDSKLYDSFQKYCDKKAYLLSRKIELLIEEELTKEGKKNG